MNGFTRTLFIGLGVLSILAVTFAVTLFVLFMTSDDARSRLRNMVISAEERRALQTWRQREDEAPLLPARRDAQGYEAALNEIAQRINETRVREMVEQLSQREAALEERSRYIDQREAELRLAQGDLLRLQRQLETLRRELRDTRHELDRRQQDFAAVQLDNHRQIQVLSDVERARAREMAETYAMMRNPWQQLRQLAPRDIARFLALMEPKRAARILDMAVADVEMPGVSTRIHGAMLALDLDGTSGDQTRRLASLYNLMRPAQTLPFLATSEPDEVARIMAAMEARPRAALQEALHSDDPERAVAVARAMDRINPERAGAQP